MTLAPATVRTRKIENGISGNRTRASITRNAASSTADAISRTIVQAEPQPWSGACETAYTSSASPAVTVTAPPTSKELSRSDGSPARAGG